MIRPVSVYMFEWVLPLISSYCFHYELTFGIPHSKHDMSVHTLDIRRMSDVAPPSNFRSKLDPHREKIKLFLKILVFILWMIPDRSTHITMRAPDSPLIFPFSIIDRVEL